LVFPNLSWEEAGIPVSRYFNEKTQTVTRRTEAQMTKMTAKTRPPAKRRKKRPHVGIFWLVDGKLVIDSVPLSEVEPSATTSPISAAIWKFGPRSRRKAPHPTSLNKKSRLAVVWCATERPDDSPSSPTDTS
jgi:hypothetical protein